MSPEPDFQAIFHATRVPTVVTDLELRVVAVNDPFVAVTGVPRTQLVGRSLFDVFPEDGHGGEASRETGRSVRQAFEWTRRTGESSALPVLQYDLPGADGTLARRYWSPSIHAVRVQGEVRYLLERVEDVTELVEAQPSPTPALEALTADVLARSREVHHDNVELRAMQAELEARVRERTAELERMNAALQDEMRHRERMEAQFRQAQKMEAIGQLAGGIAHDFNNLLTVILGCADGLRAEPLSALGRADLMEIKQAAQRAASLTSQLLAFSRRNVQTPVVVDLNEVVRDSETMLRRLVSDAITFAFVAGADLAPVVLDRGLLEQVLMNLVVNARDAMPRGGALTVRTANVTLHPDTPGTVLGAAPGAYTMLTVTDTGEGMSASVREHVFMPFFTTKAVGKGTGLGLSMVHGVVKQSRGEIIVETRPGEGTTFKLLFPSTTLPVTRPAERPEHPAGGLPTETVRIVEDEHQVRMVAQRALVGAGYTVVSAGDAHEALAWCRAHPTAVDLVLTDVVMPGMDGPTLVQQLHGLLGDFKVLYMSGYTGPALAQRALAVGPEAFVQKPFAPKQLLERVRQRLDAPAPENTNAATGGAAASGTS